MEESQEPKGPLWLISYADMMSLLLCFFVMLVAMSQVKDEKFQRMLDSVRKAFGYELKMDVAPGTKKRANSFLEHLRMYRTPQGNRNVQGGAETVNVRGRFLLCRTVREGMMITVGDRTGFAHASAEIPPDMKEDLNALLDLVGDYPNRLLIRGHASTEPLPAGLTQWQLSFLRARAVGEYLEAQGINPRRLRLVACGGYDPVETNLTPEGAAHNRRVELVVSEELAQDVIPRRENDD
jgi:chemotaxis protein MotB